MIIYTFYSYKGGVGRSMALANVAELFYQSGLRVLMVDWDLEAPGLERFFPGEAKELEEREGVIDLLLGYKEQMRGEWPEINEGSGLPFRKPSEIAIEVYPSTTDGGKLLLLTAGRRARGQLSEYANRVLTLDWRDFYERWEGARYFEWLRNEFFEMADVVLIDSRTGLSEMGGVCTYQFADVVVMLCSGNRQCLDGTYRMLLDLTRVEVEKQRGRPLEVFAVPARIENAESSSLNNFQAEFLSRFSPLLPERLGHSSGQLWNLAIPYIPKYAYEEAVAVRERNDPASKGMVDAYSDLAFALTRFCPEDSAVRRALKETEGKVGNKTVVRSVLGGKEFLRDENAISKSDVSVNVGFDYDVFISYSSYDKEWVRGELLTRIEQAGLKAFIDFRDIAPGASIVREMQRGVLNSRKTLAVLTPIYFQDDSTAAAINIMQTLDPTNRGLRLIPLLKDRCHPPSYIGNLAYLNFTDGADMDLAWRQLLTALGAPPVAEAPKEPERENWFLAHPYPMPPNFTGRVAEREMLDRWLDSDAAHPLLVLRALGGFGKSALAWQWLMHDVKFVAWPRVVWWSFYEGDASFDHFLVETLHYLGGGKIQADKLSGKNAVGALLDKLRAPGTLLVLDGFERVLRAFGGLDAAYKGDEVKEEVGSGKGEERREKEDGSDRDCISPLAEDFLRHLALHPKLRSKVLMTTRLCPRVLEAKGGGFLAGCREEELRQMQPADAVEFFRAQGIRGTHTEIEQACEPYGYHPLSLRLLAGYIMGDIRQPGDIAAAKRLDVSGDLVQRRHHVLEAAYDSLTPERRALLGRIACFRSPVKYEALKALAGTEPPLPALSPVNGGEDLRNLDADLRDLIARGLLQCERSDGKESGKESRFDLHPIVRRYAYDRLAAPDRAAAHTQLRDYFTAVPQPNKVTCLEDLAPVIELYHHTVRAGQYDEAFTQYRNRLADVIYFQLGAYVLQIDLLRALFPDGEEHPPRLKDEGAQAWTLNMLACVYSLSGQPRRAVPLFEHQIAIREQQGNKSNLAMSLGNLACMAQNHIGALRAAEANLRHSIALFREIWDAAQEAVEHQELGWLLAYRGAYAESEMELALAIAETNENLQMQGITRVYRAQCELLRLRSNPDPTFCSEYSVVESAHRALQLADETARTRQPYERDYVRGHWVLGAAHRSAGEHDEAERYLHKALERCRCINYVVHEADILIDLARLRVATASTGSGQADALDEARRLAEEALVITERSGYVLQGADARLELAKLARARGDKDAALDHAREARRLATCDGPPDYTYKAAYDEAGALLAELE